MAGDAALVSKYFDIREEREYMVDEEKHDSVEEIRQRYKFTFEFLAHKLKCAQCGSEYRPQDNFRGFLCQFHPGSIFFDDRQNNFLLSCCKQTVHDSRLTVGCVPCIHSSRKMDFEDIVLAQKGFKFLPIEMVDILRPFPIDKTMIVGTNKQEGKYAFATSQAQLLRERALNHPKRDLFEEIEEEIYTKDPFENEATEDEDLLAAYSNGIRVSDDNWKIKLLIH